MTQSAERVSKPIPQPDDRSRPFFEGAQRGELMIQQCTSCGAYLAPGSRACTECLNEALDWVPGEDMNSLCVLVVHTAGAARFWFGDAALGDISNRDRAAEFRASGLSHAELKARFAALEEYVRGAIGRLTLSDLGSVRPIPGRSGEITVGDALLHTMEHTGVHLGHAQITRQLWQQKQG